MLKNISIAALFALLSISSCKKQIVKGKVLKGCRAQAEKNNIFSPVSESDAKKFVDASTKKDRKNRINVNLVSVGAQDLDDIIQLHEAKLSDVPIPLNSEPLRECFDYCCADKKIILGYISDIKTLDVVKFYNNQMERLGWEKVALFEGFETLIIFKKPARFCSISVRECSCPNYSKQEHTKIVIFTQF